MTAMTHFCRIGRHDECKRRHISACKCPCHEEPEPELEPEPEPAE